MRTYRQLFRAPGFTPLFVTSCLQNGAVTVAGLALATGVWDRTGSPLLTALSMFGPSIAQLAGATLLMSAADRLPPRAATVGVATLTAALTAALAVPGLPMWALFVVLLGMGLVGSVGGGVRNGLLNDLLPDGAYLLGRSTLNISVGIMQIAGFAIGGALVTVISPAGALLSAAALHLVAAAVARLGLTGRAPRATGRPSIAATWQVNARLLAIPRVRPIYLAMWLPNGLIVGCEALFVPFAPSGAGLLLAGSALGMLAGDVLAGRFLPPLWRRRLAPFLRLVLAAPYLLFALHPPLPTAIALTVIAAVGYCSTLLLQERLVDLTPPENRGQALGLVSSGMLTMQAVCAALAGSLAELTSPATAITLLAAASVAVTLALATPLREPAPEKINA
jgi:predicted MFS family arabinose efflux permease